MGDSGSAVQEMNAFLQGNKILEVENQLISNEHGAYWCFCVRYIERTYPERRAGEVPSLAGKAEGIWKEKTE